MRKVIAVILLILLVSCSNNIKIHKEIGENLARDSMQVLEMVESFINDDEPLDKKVLDKYTEVYFEEVDGSFNGTIDIETELFLETYQVIEQAEDFQLLESGKSKFESLKEKIIHIIENGERKPYEQE